MANLVLKSEQQILGSMAQVVMARTGLNDLNPGSILLTLLQAAAAENFQQYYQMLQIIRNYNIDTTSGTDLDTRAFEYGLTRGNLLASTGRIDILRESTFKVISTTFYTGVRSSIAGDTTLYLNNAGDFPTTGSAQTLVIGRGTPNEEEVTYNPSVSNPQNNVNFYTLALSTPLTNDHALDETVILKQGTDIFIRSGTIIQVPATGRTQTITFSTTVDATILAGDGSVTDINVKCNQPGSIGNIGVNAITGTTAFPNPPFAGAQAINNSSYSDGQDKETDTLLRSRIKAHIQGINQSTQSGISNAIKGLVDPTTAKRVVSSNIFLPDNVGLPVEIYIDDGTGFEPDFGSQGEEVIVSAAQGTETRLQLQLFPLVKAQVESLNAEPFNFSTNGLTLALNVGNEGETITFFNTSFSIPSAGSAYEVVKAINAVSNLVEARTAEGGTKITLSAKADSNEVIQVTGGTANVSTVLNFPTEKVQTFYLYKNDRLLSKDGVTASVDSGNSQPYNFSGANQTLSVTVDGKTANTQTVTIHQSDFLSIPDATSATAESVAAIINAQLAGATAFAVSGKVRIISNTPLSSNSKIKINTSSAQSTLGFSTTQVIGQDQDYTLNPELGVISLNAPLVASDLITAGTRNTRGFLTASVPQSYTFTGGETLAIKVDGGSTQTITFVSALSRSATQVATFINSTLVGGTAVTRTKGSSTFLEIRTNTMDTSGSIEILSSSTSNTLFGFTTDTVVSSILAHTASQLTQNSGPYSMVQGNSLVVVIDNDTSGKTFVITMSYDSTVTSGVSTTLFGAGNLIPTFLTNSSLINFWVVFKSGGNTTSGSIAQVQNPSGSVFKYFFANPAPANFQSFAIGDQATFSGMTNAGNNGNFLITGTSTINTAQAAVKTKTISNPSGLTPLTGDRYLVGLSANTTTTSPSVIDVNISNPTGLSPSSGDKHIIATAANDISLADVQGRYADSNNIAVQQINGYRYIVDGSGLNAWVGHDNQIAIYNGVGTPGWLFYTPTDEDVAFSVADSKIYQFDGISGTWIQNDWGGKAGKIANWNGSIWTFINPLDTEVRLISSLSKHYQYALSSNTWVRNDWGGMANQLAQWTGSAWAFTAPSTNDTVTITDESLTYQYSGTAWSPFAYWVQVTNLSGVIETTSSGSGLIGQRRQISNYNANSGAITLASATRTTPVLNDHFTVIPGTRQNIVSYFNNNKITSLASSADIELADQGTQVQIISKADGSDGYVQVTGGSANTALQFSTTLVKGLRAYDYYTGLIKLVHSTVYGDETDPSTFPGVGAAGVKFQIKAPTVNEQKFTVNVTLAQGLSFSSLENEIKTQIISYVDTLGIGKEVILAAIVELLMEINGVIDVDILFPTSNVVIAQNELARTKASLISVNSV